MSMHKLTVGDGYTYLTRHVAAGDGGLASGDSLTAYYELTHQDHLPGRPVQADRGTARKRPRRRGGGPLDPGIGLLDARARPALPRPRRRLAAPTRAAPPTAPAGWSTSSKTSATPSPSIRPADLSTKRRPGSARTLPRAHSRRFTGQSKPVIDPVHTCRDEILGAWRPDWSGGTAAPLMSTSDQTGAPSRRAARRGDLQSDQPSAGISCGTPGTPSSKTRVSCALRSLGLNGTTPAATSDGENQPMP